MVEKLIFSLEIFVLGFSVVMVVLFALYGLTLLFYRINFSGKSKKESTVLPAVAGGKPSPQLAVALAVALDYHRKGVFVSDSTICLKVERGDKDYWCTTGPNILRRKRY